MRELGFLHGADQGDSALELVGINDAVAPAISIDRRPRDRAERGIASRPVGGEVAEGSIGEHAFGQNFRRDAVIGDLIAGLKRCLGDLLGMRGERT